jgi:streptomycin 3"-adenylyltransferase
MEAPASARAQLDRLTDGLQTTLGNALVGLYVHGSLALGCFNAAQSDIDVLAVGGRALTRAEKLALVDLFLRISLDPSPVEADVLSVAQLQDWRHPSPFELHYSEWRRDRWTADPRATLASFPTENADLAAHVAVTRDRGIPLVGPPPETVFPQVTDSDFRDSLLRDLEWSRTADPAVYGVLSPCRIWATLETRELHSKASGARWALPRLPEELRPMVEQALASYGGAGEAIDVHEDERQHLIDVVEERVRR